MTFKPAQVQHLHDGPVKALAIGGGRLVTGGGDRVVRVLTDGGDHLGSYRHDDIVNGVAVAHDGSVASASKDRSVRVWDDSSQRSYRVGDHDLWTMAIAWSPGADRLVTGSEDGTIGFWDPDGAGVTRIAVGSPVNGVDWKGSIVAAVTGDRRLLLLGPDGEVLRQVAGAEQMLWDVAISPSAPDVAWVGRDRLLWLLPEGATEPLRVPAHRDQIWSVSWSSDGDRLLTASADGTVALWTSRGEPVERVAVGSWARRALLHDGTLLVTTEEGDLRTFEDDGGDPAQPVPVPEPSYPERCEHWDPQVEETTVRRCEECDSTEELRLCVTCGHVGCCESQQAHGTKHWLDSGHPNTVPVGTGPYRWRWCYADDMYVKRTA